MTKEQEAIKYFKNYTIYTKQLSEDEKRVNGQSIYQKDMEKRAKYFETVLSMLKEKDKELEKKDKQIDYIIDWIRERSIYAVDSHEKLKQYFERKATNNG